jgi:Ribbon-helix-helix protein, copG family
LAMAVPQKGTREMREKFCDEQMQFKLPQELVEAITKIARQRMMSRSAYCRQALLEKLERDGLCLLIANTVAA